MGRVSVQAIVESFEVLWDVERGLLAADRVRRLVVADALVDTGATFLALPTTMIQQFGLRKRSRKRSRTATGSCEVSTLLAGYRPITGSTRRSRR